MTEQTFCQIFKYESNCSDENNLTVTTMKTQLNLLIASALIIFNISANAAVKDNHKEVKTTAHALALCKAKAEKAHPGYKRSTAKKIKQIRNRFKLDLLVLTQNGKIKTQCEVTSDGKVTYSKKS